MQNDIRTSFEMFENERFAGFSIDMATPQENMLEPENEHLVGDILKIGFSLRVIS